MTPLFVHLVRACTCHACSEGLWSTAVGDLVDSSIVFPLRLVSRLIEILSGRERLRQLTGTIAQYVQYQYGAKKYSACGFAPPKAYTSIKLYRRCLSLAKRKAAGDCSSWRAPYGSDKPPANAPLRTASGASGGNSCARAVARKGHSTTQRRKDGAARAVLLRCGTARYWRWI